MRLKNKRTGEIGELQITEKHCAVVVGNGTANCNVKLYCSLDRLNEEWEDAPEEPKECKYWYIDVDDDDVYQTDDQKWLHDRNRKLIGNYFETKEEAEKAVEKLKAWKRLKDKGFRFRKWDWLPDQNIICGNIGFYIKDYNVDTDDLDLLFGGEE